ncbi:phosphodiester glycosidase family protein [Salegentibacter sp. Hel_I_6]|uniref:phosphodiester glycosidase family protein n=1 Tax=Salegentibacter sp. Hel_I_6 TaxID=1250278 RepID=UPI0006894E23|nr:phosphodiester glycosidase family protein [Salegentibacter sp. Hel_I_6]
MKAPKLFTVILGLLSFSYFQAQQINLNWEPREDLNINLPGSIKIFDALGTLPDGEPLRAMYAEIDLRDKNLYLRSIGSNTIRETTKETAEKVNGILAINGGYFASNSSVSTIIQDGEVIAPGPAGEIIKGAFGIKNRKPEIAWVNSGADGVPEKFAAPDISSASENWEVSQGVGGGPVLLKNGEINVTDTEEGFGGSHIQRHPRSAIGFKDQATLIVMVVDGRQEASAGVTLPELAKILYEIDVKEAVNLDGGGSSAMVAAEEVVNIPSDITGGNRNSLRNNAGALVISEIQTSELPKNIILDTESDNYSETGIWKNSNLVNYYGETASRMAASNKINKAYYTFTGIQRNDYQLAAWFSVNTSENAQKVNYILHSEGKTDTITFDQTSLRNSGKWNVLGHFEIGPKDSLEIMGVSEGKFTADAIRLVIRKYSPELPKRGNTRIAVISDLNSGLGAADYEWQVDSIINRIPKIWQPDLVICGGDMVAGMGISKTEQLQKMWEGFDTHIAQPLKEAGIPFAFTLGNHDGPRAYPLERDFAKEFWNKNENKPNLNFVDDSHFPNYYSFLQNDIFFVSWEASSSKITEENLKWMEKQFQTSEAKNAKLRFVMGHMPLYSVAQERDSKGNVLEEPEKLQNLLEKYNVHTYISGHQHAYYPGKRGRLELLNTGAAGSGPRAWLTQNSKPVNTITIMDIFQEKDSIVYSTYDIKKEKAADMPLFDKKTLPSAMFGINGYILRRDIQKAKQAKGFLSSLNIEGNDISGIGHVKAEIEGENLKISGEYFNLEGKISDEEAVGIYRGRHTQEGEFLKELKLNNTGKGSGSFRGKLKLTEEILDYLSIGALYFQIKTDKGSLRTQLYPENNKAPAPTEITSHNSKNTYAVRDIEALYNLDWEQSLDEDGDFVSYVYQISKNKDFSEVVFQEKTGRETGLKRTEKQWFTLLENSKIGEPITFYHRVMASDGSNISSSEITKFKLMKSEEPLDDFAEISAPKYIFKGKIENSGSGYGAEWDGEGKLWLADYNRGLIIKTKAGENANFSPLTSVEIKGEIYKLSPVNGIGVDLDGNILAGINRRLIKINAKTGKGIAVWESPEGTRAITSPRAAETGEIFATSLFGEDPNYILKQEGTTFKLLRTIELKGRNLSRTFDMTPDGKTLYLPDPGSPKIQVYSSEDGVEYKKEKEISSISAGSSAVQIIGNAIYAAIRSSGISPSTFYYRNEEKQQMWTMELPEVNGAEPRGIGVSKDENTLIFCSWDKGGGYYLYEKKAFPMQKEE